MRIFIAHSHHDATIAEQVAAALTELDHEVSRADTFLAAGDIVENRIRDELDRVDALIILWSSSAAESASIRTEIGYFLGLKKPIFPVLIDNASIADELAQYNHFIARDIPPSEIALRIATYLSRFEGERKQDREHAEQRQIAVERTSEKYISDSLKSLGERESKYQRWSLACYGTGYVTLLLGLFYAVYRALETPPQLSDLPQSIYVSALTLTIIGFLAAASRFAFILGKSFMVEALRNHDRIHAIKYGEFYLKAFGQAASWDELKEAFQHWNLDTGSTFKEQNEDAVDPQILKLINEIVKNAKP